MRRIFPTLGMIVLQTFILVIGVTVATATTYTVSTSFSYYDYVYAFSPSTVTITLGDTVNFAVGSIHTATEVSQATWDANGNTPNGGFDTPYGGGIVVPTHTGTYYYVCAAHYSMGMKGIIMVSAPTGVIDQRPGLPAQYALIQNFPNPFNPSTSIRYTLPVQSSVRITVLDINGQVVTTLVDQVQEAGDQSIIWNPSGLASGVYFYRMEATGVSDARRTFKDLHKMILLK